MAEAFWGVVALLAVVGLILWGIYLVVRRVLYSRRLRARRALAHAAALTASLDDPAFEPDRVEAKARELFATVSGRHRGDELEYATRMLGGGVVEGTNWSGRSTGRADRNWVRIKGRPRIAIVGVRNLEGTEADRVVVRVDSRVRRWHRWLGPYWLARALHVIFFLPLVRFDGAMALAYRAEAYWTFASRPEGWELLTVQAGIQGAHNLDEPLITASWEEMARLHTDAVGELAQADAAPGTPRALHSASASPTEAAADAGAADARFAPFTIEASVQRITAAWAEARYDDGTALFDVASARSRIALMPDALNGLRLQSHDLVGFYGQATPPTVDVEIEVRGRAGDASSSKLPGWFPQVMQRHHQRWTLTLTDDPACPWHLSEVAEPRLGLGTDL